LLGGWAGVAWSEQAGADGPTDHVARTADEIPFSGGMLEIPCLGGTNNRGIIQQQTVPGQTHVDMVLHWRFLEPEKGRWNNGELNEMLALCRARKLKLLVLPEIIFTPEWFRKSPDYTPLADMRTGKTVDMLSPWAPGTLAAFDYFYAELARRYGPAVDILKIAYPGSDFGEVGMLMGAKCFLPGSRGYRDFPQDPAIWKMGYWCGDAYARADFRRQMLAKYGDLARLNAAWGTQFAAPAAIDFPEPEQRASQRIRWLDFMTWYQGSHADNLVKILQVIRKHFPRTLIEIPMGYGSDEPLGTADRTAVCRAAARFMPVSIRSTHGSFNRGGLARAYWFYKRMAPVCHELGLGFGTEPPGGDLTYAELQRQYFEDASAGMNLVFHYYQNFNLRRNVVEEYKRVLRPQERSLVDIGVLYPSTQMLLDLSAFPGWPGGQIEFCSLGREFFDYDIVDENMIDWGMLKSYKVLVHTSGTIYRQSTLRAMTDWLRVGGILITRGRPEWADWQGHTESAAAWLKGTTPDAHVFRVGRGGVHVVEAKKIPDYLASVVAILNAAADRPSNSPLHGLDGKDDGKYVTDFPSGRLVFDTKTLSTQFVPQASAPARCCISESHDYRNANPELARKRFHLYRQLGVDMIRTEFGWREMESRENKWADPSRLSHIQLAQAEGFQLKMNVGTISAPPAWFLAAHPEAKIVSQYGDSSFNTISLWYPDLHPLIERVTDRMFQYMAEAGLFKNLRFIAPDFGPASEPLYPAAWTMGSKCTHGEAFWCYDANAQAEFLRQMKAKYGNIAAANARWKSHFQDWNEVIIPQPGGRPGAFWEDVLTWYRNTKREFVLWQIANFKTHMAKYNLNQVPLLLYVPGTHVTAEQWREAVESGSGAKSVRIMCDSEFLLETARNEQCWLQYTASGNEKEVAYLTGYMKQHGLGSIPMWGENAGDSHAAGNPGHLADVIVDHGLYGLDYTHSHYVFEPDGITPNTLFAQVKEAYSRISRCAQLP
jgi:hypothetical protein